MKKLTAIPLTSAMVWLMQTTFISGANRVFLDESNLEEFFYLESDEQIILDATLEDDFIDDSVIGVLNRATSRSDRQFTVEDFKDIGAVSVEYISYLSEKEEVYAQQVWEAEREVALSERRMRLSGNIAAEQMRQKGI